MAGLCRRCLAPVRAETGKYPKPGLISAGEVTARLDNAILEDRPKFSLVRILFHDDVRVWSQAGEDLRPKARKAQALLAIVGLAADGLVPRTRLANLLWSASEPSVRLARLRDLVHVLRISMGQAGADILDVTGDRIGFRSGRVHLEFGLAEDPSVPGDSPPQFLADLEGIDPALDQWLTGLRLDRRRMANGPDVPSVRDRKPGLRNNVGRCTLAVTAVAVAELGDPDLAASILGQLSHVLTRLRWFRTITRDGTGRMLHVGNQDLSAMADYALVCNIRSSSGIHELFVELIAFNQDPRVVWTSSFEMVREVARGQQVELAEKVAAQVDTELLMAEAARCTHAPVDDRDAYRLVLQAVPAIHQLERERFLGVGRLLEQAVEVDPDSAFAHSWLAYWYIFLVGQGWARSPGQVMAKAGRAADRAMVLDPRDARGFAVAGHVRAFIGKHLDEATALHGIALQLNPSLPLALHLSGMTSAYAGRLDEALSRIGRCQDLVEAGPDSFLFEGGLAIVYLLKHEHEKSAEIGRRVTERHPSFTSAYKSTISALGHLGEQVTARRLVNRLKHLEPHFTLRGFQSTAPYRRREDMAHFMRGLRLAGVT